MPRPGPAPATTEAAFAQLKKEIDRLNRRLASASGLAIVDPDEPADPAVGQLWYDTDDTC